MLNIISLARCCWGRITFPEIEEKKTQSEPESWHQRRAPHRKVTPPTPQASAKNPRRASKQPCDEWPRQEKRRFFQPGDGRVTTQTPGGGLGRESFVSLLFNFTICTRAYSQWHFHFRKKSGALIIWVTQSMSTALVIKMAVHWTLTALALWMLPQVPCLLAFLPARKVGESASWHSWQLVSR